ncbi:YafY family transcriptional regulator [Paenibacillus psychroresistens]|uniref:YafY family transcriptional regulator n=1 Tax=Paenibacillus psychroresistens TaxID=1778678 RepID=A0A6B8RUI3_9BACL|nr:YafY family protein [Paenibacillus psychroresistens]QGQ99424.1 YafY family transcriptional regulator [Paenibacillus psychroresistens]
MRADRLLSILLCLQTTDKINTRELAEKFEVSERTILRDMDALSTSGVPVVSDRGAAGGWRLMEGYRTNLTGLKADEIQSLLLANTTHILGDLGMRANYDMATLKLLASLPQAVQQDAARVRQRIHVDGAGWYQANEPVPCLTTIQDAIWMEHKLQITYLRQDQATERLVDPLGIVVKGTIWYMVAAVESELRTYRVSRIQQAIITDDPFIRPAEFELVAFWEQSTKDFKANLPQYPAVIKLKPQAHLRLQKERFVAIQEIRSSHEDWMILEVYFQTLETACQTVLSYGADLIVIEPAALRKLTHETMAAALKLYD